MGVSVTLREAEVDYVDKAKVCVASDEEIVGFHVAVNAVTTVDVGQPIDLTNGRESRKKSRPDKQEGGTRIRSRPFVRSPHHLNA